MDKRGAGLAVVGIALAAAVSGCGGSATASEPAPTVTASPTIDVEAIARDEIAAIDALGYPTELVTWDFRDDFENANGGTAWSSGDLEGFTTITVSTAAEEYRKYSDDLEAAVRSTVRHEFGHALTYWLYPEGAEVPLRDICVSVSTASLKTGSHAGECAAEAANVIISAQRDDERIPFYGLTISDDSLNAMRPIVEDSLSWTITSPTG